MRAWRLVRALGRAAGARGRGAHDRLAGMSERTTTVAVGAEAIRLGDFLKLAGAVSTGGEAKMRIQAGEVLVNGERETRRGRKLRAGDVVSLGGERFAVGT